MILCIAIFVGTDFFISIPLTPVGSTPAIDLTIGTPFSQADYVVESIEAEISSGSTMSSNPAVVRVQNTFRVTVSDFSNRMKGIRVRATGENPIYVLVVIIYNDFGLFRSLIGSCSYLVHPNNEFLSEESYVYYAVSFDG